MINFLSMTQSFLYAAILASVPLLFGTVGEIITEKAGNLNLGVEGMMYMGAIFSFMGAYYYESIIIAVIFGFLGGMLGAFIYSFLTVTLKADQVVTGLVLTIFGTGLANLLGSGIVKASATGNITLQESVKAMSRPINLGFLTDLPVVGKLLFTHSFFTYLAVLFAILAGVYINHTRWGHNLRAIGENPSAADATGVSVDKYKYFHIMFGGGLAGLGGAYISLVTCGGTWTYNCVAGQGWIAVALVIFAAWKPSRAIFGSLFFGALSVLRLYLPRSVVDIPPAIFQMLPFVVTSVVLIISSIRMRHENQQPAASGINYFREER